MDEMLTPDSSRYWPADEYQVGTSPPSYDKQFVRDYLETLDWNKTAPGPRLPADVIDAHARQVRRGAAAPGRHLRRLTPAIAHGRTRMTTRRTRAPDRPLVRPAIPDDHRNATNQRIHVVAVPAILWSVIALLWCIPVAGHAGSGPGLWAALAMFGAWMFYYRASRRLGSACWRCSSRWRG